MKDLKQELTKLFDSLILDPERMARYVAKWRGGGANKLNSSRLSFLNNLLLLIQMDYRQMGEPTLVGGFKQWGQFKRHVKAGEKALRIMAPMIYQKKTEEETIRGFKAVAVFDLCQTEGEDVPIPGIVDDVMGQSIVTLDQAIEACPFPVEITTNKYVSANGKTDGKTIWITDRGEEQQNTGMLLTLFHEWGHASMKHLEDDQSYPAHELEAESFSFILANGVGLEHLSAKDYIANWSANMKEKVDGYWMNDVRSERIMAQVNIALRQMGVTS
jgi:hypothetical protein